MRYDGDDSSGQISPWHIIATVLEFWLKFDPVEHRKPRGDRSNAEACAQLHRGNLLAWLYDFQGLAHLVEV